MISPKLCEDSLLDERLQSFFFAIYITTEVILLSMMAYDRYVAITNPLMYTVIMTHRICTQMVLACYLGGLLNSLIHTIGLLRLDFCGPNIVNHFFCDVPPLLKLSCSDAHINEMLLLIFSGVIAIFTFIIIVVSYSHILIAILRIRSVEGRRKAFSTCASHLTAVTLLYGSVAFSYIQPSSQYSMEQEKVSAVFYTLVIPMLNPLIYSLRNKDVKEAAKSNLSFCDVCYSTIFAPKMLVNFLSEHKSSMFFACVLQSFFFAVYVTTEGILLSMMAYDRYVAITNPLMYTVIMTHRICTQMVLACYLGGLINSLTHTIGLLRLDFCGPNIVNHFFCDIPPLLKLSCSDAHINEMLLLIFSGVIAIFTFIVIIVSYSHILIAILRIRSVEGRRKAFSTCASHLTAVTLFYGSVAFSYIQPSSQYSMEQEKVSAVFYTLIIPMLNPLIYSLRNKDVKKAAKRSICRGRSNS
ncbi:hypothetical protein U0070_003760 [Myodes glareolus]|uniref:G-protein coupled receptors family 1 profile domain-containing protein n=1 Tax=Myodes glareolus TaxID=447135 RepID=A0AAW0HFN1_MYOGA